MDKLRKMTSKFFRIGKAAQQPKSPVERNIDRPLRRSQSLPAWAYNPVVADEVRATDHLTMNNDPRPRKTSEDGSRQPYLMPSSETGRYLTQDERHEIQRGNYSGPDRQRTVAQQPRQTDSCQDRRNPAIEAQRKDKLRAMEQYGGMDSRTLNPDSQRKWKNLDNGLAKRSNAISRRNGAKKKQDHSYGGSYPGSQRKVDVTGSDKDSFEDMWLDVSMTDAISPHTSEQFPSTFAIPLFDNSRYDELIPPRPMVRQRAVSSNISSRNVEAVHSSGRSNGHTSSSHHHGRIHHSRSQSRLRNAPLPQKAEIVKGSNRMSYKAALGYVEVPIPPVPVPVPYHPLTRANAGRPNGPREPGVPHYTMPTQLRR